MNVRLQQFLQAENISQSQFADTIGVARASVSHILAGRNKPGYDFLDGMMKNFPTLNIEWLITGKGKMYKNGFQPEFMNAAEPSIEVPKTASIATASQPVVNVPSESNIGSIGPSSASESSDDAQNAPKMAQKARRIEKIVIFYDDSTFQEIKG